MKLYYFYKIACLDINVTDCYIGSTTNFKQRYMTHKSACDNQNSIEYNYKKYQFIRSKGGFQNWFMYPIDVLESDDKIAIRKKETELMQLNNSTLNSINAYTDIKEYKKEHNKYYYTKNKDKINHKINCDCGGTYKKSNIQQHSKTAKHQTFLCQQII